MYGPKFDSAEEGSGEWGHDLMLHWSKMVERGWPARFIVNPSPSSLSIWNLSRVHRLNYKVFVLLNTCFAIWSRASDSSANTSWVLSLLSRCLARVRSVSMSTVTTVIWWGAVTRGAGGHPAAIMALVAVKSYRLYHITISLLLGFLYLDSLVVHSLQE